MANPNRRESGPPSRGGRPSERVRAVPPAAQPPAPPAGVPPVRAPAPAPRPQTAAVPKPPASRPQTAAAVPPPATRPQAGASPARPATAVQSRPATAVPGAGTAIRKNTNTTAARPSTVTRNAGNRPATTTAPGRRNASDRLGRDGGTRSTQTPSKGRTVKPQGMGLRAKFMLALSCITALAMGLLGISIANESNKYLFSQKQHDGIELAMNIAQLANSSAQQLKLLELHQDDKTSALAIQERNNVAAQLLTYISNAAAWNSSSVSPAAGGDAKGGGPKGASDILSVIIDEGAIQELSGISYGPQETDVGVQPGDPITNLFLPKDGSTIQLNDRIKVYPAFKHVDTGPPIPIYRFRIALDQDLFGDSANVRMDLDARGIDNVSHNLTIAILTGVFLAIAAVIGVANWLALNITRPVKILLKDMQVVAQGNLDHQTKPHSTDEVGILAHEFNRMTENLKDAQVALVEQEKAEYELSIAREVQKQLLPAEPPQITGFVCADYYKGAKAVSGDYYDFIPLGNGLWGFIVADVSGKGIPGSMVMAVTRTIVRLIAVKHQDRAAETLKETNRLIAKQIKRGMFVTSFYAVLDERTGSLTYASAGHNPMVIYRAATRHQETATGKGIALGFNEGPIFDKTIEEHRTMLGKGDAIILYTDGFPEAMNSENVEFGEERFYQMIGELGHLDSPSLIERLVDAVAEHRGEAEQSDDLTLITVRRA